jgi:hypothetical protein
VKKIGTFFRKSEKQIRRSIVKLERLDLVRRESRYEGGCQRSNYYYVNRQHPIFSVGWSEMTSGGGQKCPGEGGQKWPGKEERIVYKNTGREETSTCRSRIAESATRNLPSIPASFPLLKSRLTAYRGETPSDAQVARIFEACEGETEESIMAALDHLEIIRGLRASTKQGPHTWRWFCTVLMDYFREKRNRMEGAHPEDFMPAASYSKVKIDDDQPF